MENTYKFPLIKIFDILYTNEYEISIIIHGKGRYSMQTVTARIDESEKEKLLKIAKEEDLTISQIIRRAIKEYLNNKG